MISRKAKRDEGYDAPEYLHRVNPEEINAHLHVGKDIDSADQDVEVTEGNDQPSLMKARLFARWQGMPEVYNLHDSKSNMTSSNPYAHRKGASFLEEYRQKPAKSKPH
jgi:hypothetical protein